MAHPFQHVRQSRVERSRVGSMTKGYASGGHPDAPQDKKLVRAMVKSSALKVEGRASGGRLDRYARGGNVKKGQTNVNVIVAPQAGAPPMGPAMASATSPPPPGLPPPMKPPMIPGAPNGVPPVPQMQSRGGRSYAKGGKIKRADGGKTFPKVMSAKDADQYQMYAAPKNYAATDKEPWYGTPMRAAEGSINALNQVDARAGTSRHNIGATGVSSSRLIGPRKVVKYADVGKSNDGPTVGDVGKMIGKAVRTVTKRATGGRALDGPAWKEGLKNGTQVQNTPGKSDTGDILRGRQITYATGGPVEAGPMGQKMTAGAYTGEGRLQKIRAQRKSR